MISRMTSKLKGLSRTFLRSEHGNTNTVSFAIWTPVFLLTLATTLEVGFYTARATMLERGVDITVRDIRLNTGSVPQHEEIKDMICDAAAIIPNCENSLRLEMVTRDLDNWVDLPYTIDCVDRSTEVTPVREFTAGMENEMVVMRACARVEPIFPLTWLSDAIHRDGAGDYAMVAHTAFVQEPR